MGEARLRFAEQNFSEAKAGPRLVTCFLSTNYSTLRKQVTRIIIKGLGCNLYHLNGFMSTSPNPTKYILSRFQFLVLPEKLLF